MVVFTVGSDKGMFCKVEVCVICYLLILSPTINHADLLVKFVASVSSLFIQKTKTFRRYFLASFGGMRILRMDDAVIGR